MTEEMKNDQVIESEQDLMDEFENLILEVSQEIIDNTVMDDLKLLRKDLTERMVNFSEEATKINTITNDIESLLSQTSVNMSNAVSKTSNDMESFLKESTEMLESKFSMLFSNMDQFFDETTESFDQRYNKITSELDATFTGSTTKLQEQFESITLELDRVLNSASSLIESQFESVAGEVQAMLNGATEHISDSVDGTTKTMANLLENTKVDIHNTITGITDTIDGILDNNIQKMDQSLVDSNQKVDFLIQQTTDNFNVEIEKMRDFMSNSDKLIRNNQKTITDAQRNIEEKLNETLVQVVDESNENKKNLAFAVKSMEDQVEKVTKDVYRLGELNNTVNIKMDHSITKMKENESKDKKKFLLMTLLNSATLIAVIVSIVFSMRG